jgi:hypothetical protein
MIRLLPLALLLLGGCTRPDQQLARCSIDAVGAVTGEAYGVELEHRLKDRTGSRQVRVIRPGTMVTQDFREDRLNIALDDGDRVTRIYCG